MANVPRVKYFTEERKALINPDNLKKYQKYLQSSIIKNKDVKDTTYKIYDNYFVQFLVYIAENWDNIDIYSSEIVIDTNGIEKLVDIETESVRKKILEIIEKMFE